MSTRFVIGVQRVSRVQVQYYKNNELSDARVPDTLMSINGRELFRAWAHNFHLKDLPAEAFSREDAVKSQSADLIERGVPTLFGHQTLNFA